MDIFKLVGSVFVDTAAAENSLSKVDNKAEKTGINFGKMASTVGTAALGIGAALVGAGAAAVKMADSAAAAADEVDKGSLRMGVSKTSYQELAYAAGQCGVDMTTMEKAAKKLEGTDLTFDDAIASIMSLGTEEERSAKAAELFGDTVAYQLSPILAGTGEDFQGLRDRAHELGIVMSDDAVSAGVKLGDTMSDVKQAFGAVVTELGSELMPVVQEVLDWVLLHMPEIKQAISVAMDVIKKVIKIVIDVVKEIAKVVDQHMPEIQATVEKTINAIKTFWETILKPALTAIIAFIRDVLAPAFKTVFETIIKPTVETVFKAIETLWTGTLKPVFTGIIEFITGVFSGDWKKAWQGVSDIFGGIFNGLVALAKAPLNGIIRLINNFIDSIGEIEIPDWVPVIGGESFSLPNIPYLAKGGTITGAGTVMVGEEGPELLNLPTGASVVPLNMAQDNKIDEVIKLLSAYLPQIGSDIVVDGKVLGRVVSKELGGML